MIVIDDITHCEHLERFKTFEDALAELRRLAAIPWDQPPNRAPCTNWRRCGREYHLVEFDVSRREQWKMLRRVPALNVSAEGVEWVNGFEEAWARS